MINIEFRLTRNDMNFDLAIMRYWLHEMRDRRFGRKPTTPKKIIRDMREIYVRYGRKPRKLTEAEERDLELELQQEND